MKFVWLRILDDIVFCIYDGDDSVLPKLKNRPSPATNQSFSTIGAHTQPNGVNRLLSDPPVRLLILTQLLLIVDGDDGSRPYTHLIGTHSLRGRISSPPP
ncbi:hypothetical protein NLJ89_g6805 [Agrocybe chaxingu]|uniref:Uncharacterized protein n=1 Tax=Agrocybe chaxingu TaxID=84603 RepID=A0A9W8JYJ3_9AGAR|nr:hypothetical protein NLJ89_g6805 [Agrocybe chaxingu]